MKILKPILSFVLLAAIMLQVLGKLIVLANYTINKNYIANVLCINKTKPKIHCNGKCHLKKQLQKEDAKEQSPANPFKEIKDLPLYFGNSSSLTPLNRLVCKTETSTFHYSFHFSTQHLQAVFHPPCA